VIGDRLAGRDIRDIARAFQLSVARGLCDAVMRLCQEHQTNVVVLSGGVFQNDLLLHDVKRGRGNVDEFPEPRRLVSSVMDDADGGTDDKTCRLSCESMGGYLGEILIQSRDKLRRLLEVMVHFAFDEAVAVPFG
jgi:Carbamoyltransferase, Kae1-like Domain, second subdomain